MTFRIRTATAADVPAMHDVRSSVRENRLSDPQRISEESYLPYVAAGSAWVAETSTGVAGFAVIDRANKSVWALFVHPEAEGMGISRALHLHMLGWAKGQGLDRIRLTTAEGTRAACFYKRAGWMQIGIGADGELVFEKTLLG